jgi:hypothetical protein
MPRPGQTPPIRANEDAPHGASAALERMATDRGAPPPVPSPDAGPAATQPSGRAARGTPAEAPTGEGELNEGFDEALFAPSGRPDEPITEGMPFGPGSSFRQQPDEDDRSFMLRVAADLEASGSSALSPFIRKIRRGG